MWFSKNDGHESAIRKTLRRFAAGLAFAVACLAAAAPAAFAAGLGIADLGCVSADGQAVVTFYNDGEPETVLHLTLSDGRGYTVTVLDGEPTPPLVLSGVTASTTLSTSWTNEAGYTQNHEGIPLEACAAGPVADATADFTLQGKPGVGNDVVVPSGQFSTPGEPVWNGTQVTVTFTAEEGHTFEGGSKTKTVTKPEVDTSTPGGPSTDPGDHDTDEEAPATSSAPEAAPAAPNQAQAPASASTAKKAPAATTRKNVGAVPEGGSGKALLAIDGQDRVNPILPIGAGLGLATGLVLIAWRRRQQLTQS